MKLLLDECVPRKFRNSLPGHDCRTVPEEGMAGKNNGELLSLAEKSGFQVFLTFDRAVILIRAKSNRLADLLPHSPEVLRVLRSIQLGELVKVG